MKKRSFILAVILVALLLTSCSLPSELDFLRPAPKTADELFLRVDERMDEQTSLRLDSTIKMKLSVNGTVLTANGTGTTVLIDDGESEYYYYEKMAITVKGAGSEETSVSLDAYHDGRYFLMQTEGETTTRQLMAEMSREEAIALRELKADDSLSGIDFTKCTEKSFEKREDGGYTLDFSGYTAADIATVWDALELDEEIFDHELIDLCLTLEIGKDYLVTELGLRLVFREDGDAPPPEIAVTMALSDYGSAERITEGLTPDGYTEVEDLAVLYRIGELWEAHKTATEDSLLFRLYSTTTVNGRIEDTTSSTCDAVFGRGENGYFQTLTYTGTELGDYTARYESGTCEITGEGSTLTTPMTEKEAREEIEELYDAGYDYSPDKITAISFEDNTYILGVTSMQGDTVTQILGATGATAVTCRESIRVSLGEDDIGWIEFRTEASGYLAGSHVSITLCCFFTFR